ncbi:hypothetical protein DDZ18_06205 [Marinicauda salina]|uniref:Type II toxin-antitoxin system HicA family toxin n=1 Tax=Marinicauda salina TaxID=2135793 RepID=A0A2U2BTF7_9PROT|nr:hypothetical protein DDZ18_06205 [Marinicauda salina]
MSGRPRHPDKDIEAAVAYLEGLGWRWRKAGGSAHAWGRMLCPRNDRSGCQCSVWTTPRNPRAHARTLRRYGDRCGHGREEADDEGV